MNGFGDNMVVSLAPEPVHICVVVNDMVSLCFSKA